MRPMEAPSIRERRGRFGDYLRMKRGFRTAEEVASTVNRQRLWYVRIETGSREHLGLRDIRLLARALGLDLKELAIEAERAGY